MNGIQKYRFACTLNFGDVYGQIIVWLIVIFCSRGLLTLPALKYGDSSFIEPTCLAGLTTNRVVEAFQLAPLLGGEASRLPEALISRSIFGYSIPLLPNPVG